MSKSWPLPGFLWHSLWWGHWSQVSRMVRLLHPKLVKWPYLNNHYFTIIPGFAVQKGQGVPGRTVLVLCHPFALFDILESYKKSQQENNYFKLTCHQIFSNSLPHIQLYPLKVGGCITPGVSYIWVYYTRCYCSYPAVNGKFLLHQRAHVGMENNHPFSSCWDSEFNLPLDFTPLKYKRKKKALFFPHSGYKRRKWGSRAHEILLEKAISRSSQRRVACLICIELAKKFVRVCCELLQKNPNLPLTAGYEQ